jgi:hypothetical protein
VVELGGLREAQIAPLSLDGLKKEGIIVLQFFFIGIFSYLELLFRNGFGIITGLVIMLVTFGGVQYGRNGTSYVAAVKYVSHKLMGASNIAAYTRTFPDKYQDFVNRGIDPKDIASYVTAYNKSKLVNLIMELTLIPSYVLNQDLYQKALNVQAELMISAKSETVRCDAANSLLTQLKMPEVTKVQMDLNVKEDGSIAALRATTLELAKQQRLMLESGAMNAQDVAHTKLVIDGEYEEV